MLGAPTRDALLVSQDNRIYALSTLSGALQWTFSTGGQILWSTPTIGADGLVYGALCTEGHACSRTHLGPTALLAMLFATLV